MPTTLQHENFNIGILGHVDSGKTSLAKVLSEVASTACFDKNPQSKERGITLDLGFSSFALDHENAASGKFLITLVDCPGHASLLKTVIGGAHIIDMMILVIDVNKGIQTQTAECLIIGELTCDTLLVVLNKIDMIEEEKRDIKIGKVRKKIAATLAQTKFKDCPIVSLSATEKLGVDNLIATISSNISLPTRQDSGDFVFAVDHCFVVKGQGTVLTGTCIQGAVKVNDVVQIADLKLERKVKSIQVFKNSVNRIIQGDRAGICVPQFDPKLLERGLIFTGTIVQKTYGLIIDINKIKYYKGSITDKMKYHVSIGHETVLAKITFFAPTNPSSNFDLEKEYIFNETIMEDTKQFALLEFDQPVQCVKNSVVIISRLDMNTNTPACRLAFHGTIRHMFLNQSYAETDLEKIKIFKWKERSGIVDRISSDYEVIGKDLFKKETNIDLFVNLKVSLSTGEMGKIEGSFGQSGKFKVYIDDGLKESTKLLVGSGKKGKSAPSEKNQKIEIHLKFKRFVFDKNKTMQQ